MWDGVISEPGLAGVIDSAAVELGCKPTHADKITQPKTLSELNDYFAKVQSYISTAYAPVKTHLDELGANLVELVNPDSDFTAGVDTIPDPLQQHNERLAMEKKLAGMFGDADKVNFSDLVSGARMLAALADTNWVARSPRISKKSMRYIRTRNR